MCVKPGLGFNLQVTAKRVYIASPQDNALCGHKRQGTRTSRWNPRAKGSFFKIRPFHNHNGRFV